MFVLTFTLLDLFADLLGVFHQETLDCGRHLLLLCFLVFLGHTLNQLFLLLGDLSLDVRVAEIGRPLGLKVTKLLQEPGDLQHNDKEIISLGGVVHIEQLKSLTVLHDRVIAPLLEELPVSAEVILGEGVKQQQEGLDRRDGLLEVEVVLCQEEVVSLFLQHSNGLLLGLHQGGDVLVYTDG